VYQKRFANESGLLWTYDRCRGTFDERHPIVICRENDLYAVKPQDAKRDQRLESIVLAQLDGDCATGVRSLIYPLTGLPGLYVSSLVAFFVGLQYSRIPSMRDYVTKMWEQSITEMMRLNSVNEGRMQSVINKYERDTGDKLDVSAKTMVETIRRGGIKLVITETPFLRYVFDTAKMIADSIISASWEILRAPVETGFILCDAPVTVVPPRGVDQVGFHVPGTVTYVPLARGHCLRLTRPYRRLRYRNVDRETVELINQNIAANSDRFVMSPVREELEAVIELSGCKTPNKIPRASFWELEKDDNGSFQGFKMNPRSYFYLPDGRTF
jgi:hypothetical protein